MELKLREEKFYRVKRGQTIAQIARVFCVPPVLLARLNGLSGEVEEGAVLILPKEKSHLYTLRGGESKKLLCGSDEAFERRNLTKRIYPGQIVFL